MLRGAAAGARLPGLARRRLWRIRTRRRRPRRAPRGPPASTQQLPGGATRSPEAARPRHRARRAGRRTGACSPPRTPGAPARPRGGGLARGGPWMCGARAKAARATGPLWTADPRTMCRPATSATRAPAPGLTLPSGLGQVGRVLRGGQRAAERRMDACWQTMQALMQA